MFPRLHHLQISTRTVSRQQKDSRYEERMTKVTQAYNDGKEPSVRAAGEI